MRPEQKLFCPKLHTVQAVSSQISALAGKNGVNVVDILLASSGPTPNCSLVCHTKNRISSREKASFVLIVWAHEQATDTLGRTLRIISI